jgi:hypothetical protein
LLAGAGRTVGAGATPPAGKHPITLYLSTTLIKKEIREYYMLYGKSEIRDVGCSQTKGEQDNWRGM